MARDDVRTRALTSLLAGLGLIGCGATDSDPPNVVVVLLDTLRPDRLGTYGCERGTSPVLDAMADEFFVFEHAQSSAPWTAPSLISLMTSSYPDVHGVHSFPIPDRLTAALPTLAEVLQRAGYDTAAFTEGGYAKGDFGLDRGFRIYPNNPGDEGGYASNVAHPSRLSANLDRTLEWLREDREDPFLLFFHTYEVHLPLRAPEEDIRLFVPDFDEDEHMRLFHGAIDGWNERRELDLAGARALGRRLFQLGFSQLGFAQLPRIQERRDLMAAAEALGVSFEFDVAIRERANRQWVQDLYDAEVHYTDRELARLWDALASEGLEENTIVVIVSDHGESLGEHDRLGHGDHLHEELLHVVLMMRIPGSEHAPRRIPEIVRSIDVMPTLLELVGVSAEGLSLQGESLMPLMRGVGSAHYAFSHATHSDGGNDRRHSIRSDRWRLIVDLATDAVELYDTRNDGSETANLADEHPDVVADLLERLNAQRKDDELRRSIVGDPNATKLSPDSDLLDDLRGLGYAGEED